jgi:hypothetical protein
MIMMIACPWTSRRDPARRANSSRPNTTRIRAPFTASGNLKFVCAGAAGGSAGEAEDSDSDVPLAKPPARCGRASARKAWSLEAAPAPSAKWGVHILHVFLRIIYFAYFVYFITYFAYFC